jgi:hypothetical protein
MRDLGEDLNLKRMVELSSASRSARERKKTFNSLNSE